MGKFTFKNQLILVFIFLLNIGTALANVTVGGLSINENNSAVGYLTVPNSAVKTNFEFRVDLSRMLKAGSTDFEDGNSTVSLVYTSCGVCGNYTPISAEKKVTNSDFKNPATGWDMPTAHLFLSGELPSGITTGSVMLKFTYFDTNQNKTLTVYVSNIMIPIRYTPPSRVPVYEWVSTGGDYCLGMSIPVSSTKWNSRGIFFYAYNVQVPGTVPIYEFQGNVNDANGQPSWPQFVTFYSTSTQQPTILPGLGSSWTSSPKVLFYAFQTQVAGTVPVYCYSNAERNNFVFMATGEIADSYTAIQTVFYAYPITN